MVWLELLLVITVVVYYLYKKINSTIASLEARGIHVERPWSEWQDILKSFYKSPSFFVGLLKGYQRNKQYKIYAGFNFFKTIIFVSDIEFIKKIAVKDFEHFPNHEAFFDTSSDPLVGNMLTVLKDQRWKDMRNTLTPVFTASKMRAMFSLMNESYAECLGHLTKLMKSADAGGVELELKPFLTRLSNDIIASTAFGLKINSYTDENNEFYRLGQKVTTFQRFAMLKMLLGKLMPKLMDRLGISLIDKNSTSYFMKLVVNAMRQRKEQQIQRPDMIQLLLEAQKESGDKWSDADLVAQCFLFFFAAFENNANVNCFVCDELMRNPDVQQRLYEEICEMQQHLNGAVLGYDELNKMKYLDMVVSETLRKWPLGPMLERRCAKDYVLRDEQENKVAEIKAGDTVFMPLVGLHLDEEYFENPHAFVPERFSEENKHIIKAGSYIPFGLGPRSCIANRYALMQCKALVYYLLLEYKIERASKTIEDIFSDLKPLQVIPNGGFWLKFVPRNKA